MIEIIFYVSNSNKAYERGIESLIVFFTGLQNGARFLQQLSAAFRLPMGAF